MRKRKIAMFDFLTLLSILNISLYSLIEILVSQGIEFWKDYVDDEDYSDYVPKDDGIPDFIPAIEYTGLHILAKQLGKLNRLKP